MPVSDPNSYHDPRSDWLAWFRAQRVAALRPLVTPALIEEHRSNPRGPHGAALQLVLNYVRGPAVPVEGKAFAYQRSPGDFRIGVMTARGEPAGIFNDQAYASELEAQHAAFMHRLRAYGLHETSHGG